MTREQFWEAFEKLYCGGSLIEFRKLLADHPEYLREKLDQIDSELADPNSETRKKHDEWWAETRPKMAAYFGEEWMKEHCRGDISDG